MSENRLFLSGEENKYSSAVARGPRDRFNSKIPWAQFFFLYYYLAKQSSVWRDIKFAVLFCFFLFVCTVEDISTQDGAIGVKFWLRVEQTPGTGTR